VYPSGKKKGRPRKYPLPTGGTQDYKVPMVDRDAAPIAAAAGEKVSVPITEAGAIDWESMHQDGAGLGKLKAAIAADPKAADELGIKPVPEGSEAAPMVTEEHARALYAALNDLFGFAIAKRTKLPRPEIQKVIGYTESDYQKMCPLTAKTLNRHLPQKTLAIQEIGLLFAELYEVHQRKFLQLSEYLQKKQEEFLSHQPAQPVGPNGVAIDQQL